MADVRRITIPEFHAELKAQGTSDYLDLALVCPMCGTVQSARRLITAGAGSTFDDVEKYLGFSCVGRFTDAGPPPYPRTAGSDGGCNWTLGGFFRLHTLEVIDEAGTAHPRFEPATPAQAEMLRAALLTPVAADG